MVRIVRGDNSPEDLGTTSSEDTVIFGRGGNDTLQGGRGDDRLFGGAGDDTIVLSGGQDYYFGGPGDDTYVLESPSTAWNSKTLEDADAGFDVVEVSGRGWIGVAVAENVERTIVDTNISFFWGSGNADAMNAENVSSSVTILGYAGNDTISGGSDNDLVDGGEGADVMRGGRGWDSYYVDNRGDRVIEDGGTESDFVDSSVSFVLPDLVEGLDLTGRAFSGIGNDLDNGISGTDRANFLRGGAGDDVVRGQGGNDRLIGDLGDDLVWGGTGRDVMTGGQGEDVFLFLSEFDSGWRWQRADRITDFDAAEDIIDLTGVDANTRFGDVQSFRFIGDDGFSGQAGQLRLSPNFLVGDRNGDGRGDFFLRIGSADEVEMTDALIL